MKLTRIPLSLSLSSRRRVGGAQICSGGGDGDADAIEEKEEKDNRADGEN